MSGGPDARHSVSLPVFVDRTGRRRRPIVAAGVLVGVALLTSLVLLLLGLFTGSPVTVPGWPDGAAQEQEVGGGRGGAPASEPPTSPAPNRPPDVPAATPRPGGPPLATPGTAGPPQPAPTVSDRPGQGDEHRATPQGPKPSKSPGKP